MAVMKVIEVLSSSKKGWEDAAQNAVAQASKSVKNIRSIYVAEQSAVVDGDAITEFRVNVRLTFEIK